MYKVWISSKAESDLKNIYEYIACKLMSPDSARRQCANISARISRLNFFPERYQLLDLRLTVPFRRALAGNYSIIYYISGDDVIISRILYSRSDIKEKLEKLNL